MKYELGFIEKFENLSTATQYGNIYIVVKDLERLVFHLGLSKTEPTDTGGHTAFGTEQGAAKDDILGGGYVICKEKNLILFGVSVEQMHHPPEKVLEKFMPALEQIYKCQITVAGNPGSDWFETIVDNRWEPYLK